MPMRHPTPVVPVYGWGGEHLNSLGQFASQSLGSEQSLASRGLRPGLTEV